MLASDRSCDMAQVIKLKREPLLDLKHTAFPYQHDAVMAIRDMDYAAIFHEQGLGKTKIAIDLMTYWLQARQVDTVLLVVKKSLLNNWEEELAVHTALSPIRISNDRAKNFYAFNSPARLILTHYEAVKAESSRFRLFMRTRTVAAILDESTKIKNPNAALTDTFLSLAPLFKKRVIMTGTPVANRPYDIWSQIFFLDQGASLGSDFAAFKSNTDLTNELSTNRASRTDFERVTGEIAASIEGFTVRETKLGDIVTLPGKSIHSIRCDWESRQLDLYRQIREETRAIVFANGVPTLDDAEIILKRLLRLVQVASNPQLIDSSYSATPGKFVDLMDLLVRIRRRGEKSIVWTSFVATSEWLHGSLADFNPVRLNGRMDMESRNRAIQRFKTDGDIHVLVATTGAAKEGLTLTVANHAIFYDRNFSLDDYLQAQDRIHRISQSRECHVHNLLMRESIDEWVDVLLSAKSAAARLTVGDIDRDSYERTMRYDFADVLRDVLGTKRSLDEL